MRGGPLVLPMLCKIIFVNSFLRRHGGNIHVEYFLLSCFEKHVLYTVYLKQVVPWGVINFQRGREPYLCALQHIRLSKGAVIGIRLRTTDLK